jgi:hypothetical protein
LTIPGDTEARKEIAEEVERLRESEAKAWGLVERRDVIYRRRVNHNDSGFRILPLCMGSTERIDELEREYIRNSRAALAAREAGK